MSVAEKAHESFKKKDEILRDRNKQRRPLAKSDQASAVIVVENCEGKPLYITRQFSESHGSNLKKQIIPLPENKPRSERWLLMFCSKFLLTPYYRIMFYAVRRGNKPGIYPTWKECEAQVKGFKGPVFRKFSTQLEAEEFINGKGSSSKSSKTESSNGSSNGNIENKSLDIEDYEFGNDSNSIDTGLVLKSLSEMKTSITQLHQHTGLITQAITGLSNTLSTIENSILASSSRSFGNSSQTTPLKRAHSTDEGQTPKKSKSSNDDLNGNFSGIPFAESEGTIVYTDGACFNNGQKGATAGVGVYWGPNHKDNVSRSLGGRQTNNRAEIHAAIIAIEQAKSKNIDKLALFTDSEFLINSITKWIDGWKRRDWKLSTGKPVINREDFEELDQVLEGINVKWVHVRGHCGIPGNEAADRLANNGAKSNTN